MAGFDIMQLLGNTNGFQTGINGLYTGSAGDVTGQMVLDNPYAFEGYDFSSVPESQLDIGTNSTGMSGKDIAGIGLGVFNGINTMVGNDRNYRLQKKALNDQLKTSEMQRGLAADNYINQQGVRNSLAGAFGVKSTAYADAKKKYGGFSSGLGS